MMQLPQSLFEVQSYFQKVIRSIMIASVASSVFYPNYHLLSQYFCENMIICYSEITKLCG